MGAAASKLAGVPSSVLQLLPQDRRLRLLAILAAAGVTSVGAYKVLVAVLQRQFLKAKAKRTEEKKQVGHSGKKKVKIDGHFFRQLRDIITSCCGAREGVTVGCLTATLLARTLLSVWMANHIGVTVNSFCEQDWDSFYRRVFVFATVTVGAAVLNAALKYCGEMLEVDIRQKLTRHIHDLYLREKEMIYYKANKVGVDKMENTDHLIADDVDKFCETVVEVFSNSLKPAVDFLVFSVELWRVQGWVGPFGMYTWFVIATIISATVMPAYGQLAAERQVLEGRFRARHADLIVNCEQIAFMGGERPEKAVLNRSYDAIYNHEITSTNHKFLSNVVTGLVNKYFASVVGLFLISRPVHVNHNNMASYTPGDIAKYYVATSRVMADLSQSVLALFELSNRIGKLAGLTDRIAQLVSGLTRRAPVLEAEIKMNSVSNPPRFVQGDTLKFEHVSIYRPDGVLLVSDLNFEVKQGERVIITGPNGCGKSSLFRVLRGLWPLVCGTITKPADHDIYFLSQVNFVPVGSMRDLIIYPDTVAEMKARGRTDEDLRQVLQWADLGALTFNGKAPSLDDVRDWPVDLSPGQKQRMAFARLLYHRPRYAVLDECTNGISPDVEARLYNRCKKLGMAVFSISHKIELKAMHDFELHYNHDDQGTYTYLPVEHTQAVDYYKGTEFDTNVD